MIFGPRRQYPLPKFPAEVAPTFNNLRETLSVDEAKGMLPGVDEVVAEMKRQSESNVYLDVDKVVELGDRARYLIENYEKYTPAQQALIVAAVRYFAVEDDPLPEESLATGLDDDVRIMNHVLEELGVEGKFISEE